VAKRNRKAGRTSGELKNVGQLPHCRWCQKPLIKIPVGRHFLWVCDDWQCPLYRERQDNRESELEVGSE
jgi:hypothetical protein